MQFLYLLESIRNPVLNALMSLITMLGEETVVIVMAVLVFWCYNKKDGYYLIAVGFFGMLINQFLKVLFKIPRPWVIDENFTIVESAREQATGYSFPSGHTQNATSLFGAVAMFSKKRWIKITCVAVLLLVGFSRMYLGVHTPLDVGVSLLVGAVLVLGLYPLMKKFNDNNIFMAILFSSMAILGVISYIYMKGIPFPDIYPESPDVKNIQNGIYNACKLIGSSLALLVSYFIEKKFVNFETKGSILAQIIKVLVGFLLILAIKSGLSAPLAFLFGKNLGGGIRYFLIITFAVVLWPMTFKYINKLCEKIHAKVLSKLEK